jgi:hypothetical protein
MNTQEKINNHLQLMMGEIFKMDYADESNNMWEKKEAEGEMNQQLLDAEVLDLKKDDGLIQELISENAEVICSIWRSGKDVHDKLNSTIDKWLEDEAKRNLGW